MVTDFKSLKKVESLPASLQPGRVDERQRLLVIVKLRRPSRPPSYLTPRAEIGPQMFSAEINAASLGMLESDPNVESVAISRQLPLLK